MEAKFIAMLKESGTKVVNDQYAQAKITEAVKEVFIKFGVHRTVNEQRFIEEYTGTAMMLYNDITTDSRYRYLRTSEIPYCFNNGVKGRLSKNTDVVVSYKTLICWIENYISHPEYQEAVSILRNKPVPVAQQIADTSTLTDGDIQDLVKTSFNDYIGYLAREKARKERKPNDILSIGELVALPITCKDYGRTRINWLVENGFARDGESLTDVFDRAIKNGNRIERI